MEVCSNPLYGEFFAEKKSSTEVKRKQKFCDEIHSIYTLLSARVLVVVNDRGPRYPDSERPEK
jgi:hypothetical protein